ncbi:thioredoxin family protein [Agromyces atrinae]|uniref:Thiol reductase thioredoxin n=1 Tax=Agromyces atrinae TaxID=592376 RepID=A0A4Q2MAS6_9MICO|nr:thioredoxin domain-containing protein [Agromyces atrinae]NYD65819.1 thioredoxin 1 [Agromyces atrinae]RXZ86170.1 thiol reductase thioredoxin [Agromyces atrinae]
MATVALTRSDFESTITEGGIVLVDYWAAWCGPCLQFGPIYDAAAEANPDIVFGKVDTEAEQELAQAMQITSIPTIMAFRDGIGLFAQAGVLPRHALDDLITQIRGLDMDEVRKEIGRAEAEREAERETEQTVESSALTES